MQQFIGSVSESDTESKKRKQVMIRGKEDTTTG